MLVSQEEMPMEVYFLIVVSEKTWNKISWIYLITYHSPIKSLQYPTALQLMMHSLYIEILWNHLPGEIRRDVNVFSIIDFQELDPWLKMSLVF